MSDQTCTELLNMNDVDEYLSKIPPGHREALERIRAKVRVLVPSASESISYGVPTFKYFGMLCSYAAFRNHCSFFPGKQPIVECADDLSGFKTSAGTVRFGIDAPIPDEILEKLIRIAVARNELRAAKTKR